MGRREKIVIAAADCFLRAGFAETSLDEIVDSAGIVKQTLYNHFDSKETLFKEAIDLLTRKSKLELDSRWYKLPLSEFLANVGEAQLQQFRDKQTTDFLRLLVKECRKYPQLQEVYSRAIPEPMINFVVGYFGGTEISPQSTSYIRGLAWCFRAALTGYISLSNLSDVTHISLPSHAQYLSLVVSIFERLLAKVDAVVGGNHKQKDAQAAQQSSANQELLQFAEGKDKRTAILAASLKTFSRKGFAETSMEEVAVVSKVSKQTVYKYFKNKNVLYSALCDEVIEQLRGSFLPMLQQHSDSSDYLVDYVSAFVDRMRDPVLREYFRMVIGESRAFPKESASLFIYLFGFGTEVLAAQIGQATRKNVFTLAVACRSILGSFLLVRQIYTLGNDAPYADEDGLIAMLRSIVEQGVALS